MIKRVTQHIAVWVAHTHYQLVRLGRFSNIISSQICIFSTFLKFKSFCNYSNRYFQMENTILKLMWNSSWYTYTVTGKQLIIPSLLNSNAIAQFARTGFVWVALIGAATMQWDNFTWYFKLLTLNVTCTQLNLITLQTFSLVCFIDHWRNSRTHWALKSRNAVSSWWIIPSYQIKIPSLLSWCIYVWVMI